MINKIRLAYRLVSEATMQWISDGAARLGAALAYYTVFAIAPLLVLVIAIAGGLAGESAARGEIFGYLNDIFGAKTADFLQEMLAKTHRDDSTVFASLLGVMTLLIAATALFAQLQDALNIIWGVRPTGNRPFLATIKKYWWSMSMILGTGFLLLVSLVISAVISALSVFASPHLAGLGPVFEILNGVVSFLLITALFAMMFKILPNVVIEWKDVWIGSVITTLLFILGKTLLGMYLGRAATTSSYGAAGGLVVIMLWSYYSAQIFLFGAEFTQVYAAHRGAPFKPIRGYESTQDSKIKKR